MFSLLRDSLLGYDPEELVNIYTRQDEVMNMIDEGLAATDLTQNSLANQKVSTILGRPANEPPLTHLTIQELFPQTSFDQVIKTGESVTHESISFAGRQLIVKEVPIHGRGKQARRVSWSFYLTAPTPASLRRAFRRPQYVGHAARVQP